VSGVNVTICDGKYTVIQEPTGGTRVLRYGEEWRDVTGDNVICGLAWELQASREHIKRLEEAGSKLDKTADPFVLYAINEDFDEGPSPMSEVSEHYQITYDSPPTAGDHVAIDRAREDWRKAKEAKP
jgi:hypothetical protein